MLAPRVRAALTLPDGVGTRFLSSAGSRPGREWTDFRRRLDGLELSGAEFDGAVGAARWTFHWVQRVLSCALGARATVAA